MKNAVLAALVLVGMSAQASWFQENCSSADGSTKTGQGHNENYAQVTERAYDQDWNMTETVIRDEDGGLLFDTVSEQILEEERNNSCKGNQGEIAIGSWRRLAYRKLRITKADGTMFSKDIVGVSSDLMSVNVSVLCEELGNSEMMCPQK